MATRLAAPLGEAVRAATRVDRSKVAPDVGLRVALGVGVCLVVGRASGHTVAGVTATIGALSAGMASHQGTYRSRAAVVLVAAAGMGFCSAVGCLVGDQLALFAAITAVIGFSAGMLVSLGPPGTVVGIQAVVGLVVFHQFHFPLPVAARDGGLVLLGGAVQALLVVAVWPLRRFRAERRALGNAYQALSSFCREAAGGDSRTPVFDQMQFDGLDAVWRDAQPFGGDEIASYRALATQADRLRLELTALVRARVRLAGDASTGVATALLDEVLETSADVLTEVAAAIREARVPGGREPERIRFHAAREQLRATADSAGSSWSSARADEAERRVHALAGQLRAVVRTAAVPAGAQPTELDAAMTSGAATGPSRASGSTWVRERGATVRSNLTFSSQTFRHAVRMAVTLAVAVGISAALPYGHRYWLPMTALLVLRPDFTSTVARGVSRVVGTLFGAGLVTLALAELRPGPDWLIAIVIVMTFPAATLVLANYGLFSAAIASLVVSLLAFTGAPGIDTAADRSLYTLMGAAVAFAVYFAWPTWEATTLPNTLSALARTEGAYARMVLAGWADPSGVDRAGLQRARLDARLARSNAEAATSRWLVEPESRAAAHRVETVVGFMASIRSCVGALLTLHAELPGEGPGHPVAGLLADEVAVAFDQVADAVQGSSGAGAFPGLRQRQLELVDSLPAGGAGGQPPGRLVVLAGETDLLVDAVDGLGHLLGLGGVTEGT